MRPQLAGLCKPHGSSRCRTLLAGGCQATPAVPHLAGRESGGHGLRDAGLGPPHFDIMLHTAASRRLRIGLRGACITALISDPGVTGFVYWLTRGSGRIPTHSSIVKHISDPGVLLTRR